MLTTILDDEFMYDEFEYIETEWGPQYTFIRKAGRNARNIQPKTKTGTASKNRAQGTVVGPDQLSFFAGSVCNK